MIIYLRNKDIDRVKWDACVEQSSLPKIYALSWYLDRIHPGWEALVMDDYRAVFPLPAARKFGISYLHTPFFVQQLGSFSGETAPASLSLEFLQAIPRSFRLIDLQLNSSDRYPLPGFNCRMRRNLVLDLSSDYETIRSGYARNTLRNLAKAEKAFLQLDFPGDVNRLVELFQKDRGREFKEIRRIHYRRFAGLVRECLSGNRGFLASAVNETGEWLAAACFLEHSGCLYFLFSGNTSAGRENAALPWLIDRVIRKYAGGKRRLDFEGSDDPGLARFYRGFGAGEEGYPVVFLNRLPGWMVRGRKKMS